MSTENKNQPAFPTHDKRNSENKLVYSGEPGLSKREYFAVMILQGYCANPNVAGAGVTPKEKARAAVLQADDLLEQLNPTP